MRFIKKLNPFRNNSVKDHFFQGKICPTPFKMLLFSLNGEVRACPGDWQAVSVGNLNTAKNLDEIWNSKSIQRIRKSILNGDFTFCNRLKCHRIVYNGLIERNFIKDAYLQKIISKKKTVLDEGPRTIMFGNETTCNLLCPSCRDNPILLSDKEYQRLYLQRDTIIIPFLKKMKGRIVLSCVGDPFASPYYWSILDQLNPTDFPKLKVHILTNAIGFTRDFWEKNTSLHSMIESVRVSIDAATQEVYEKLRKPAKWSTLMENLSLIADLRKQNIITNFQMNFVIQRENFRELINFINWGLNIGADTIATMRLCNYKLHNAEQFMWDDVMNPQNDHYHELSEIMHHPLLSHEKILRLDF